MNFSPGRCSSCVSRTTEGFCVNEKIVEAGYDLARDINGLPSDGENYMLIYSDDEGGSFWVGPMFGCVHWVAKK